MDTGLTARALRSRVLLCACLMGASAQASPAAIPAVPGNDTTPPEPFALLDPAPGAATSDRSPDLSWESAVDEGSGIAEYRVMVEGEGWVTVPASETTYTPRLADGEYTWQVEAVDDAGNVRPSEIRAFQVDSSWPTTPVQLTPEEGAMTGPRPSFTWEASSDAHGTSRSGVVGHDVEIDGATHRVGAGATSFTPGADLTEGEHLWTVYGVDRAGNRSFPSAQRSFRVDATPPPAPVLAAPAAAAAVADRRPPLRWQIDDDVADTGDGVEVWVDGALVATHPAGTTEHTPGADLLEGLHTWRVIAFDGLGRRTASPDGSFTVDVTAPDPAGPEGPADGAALADDTPTLSWRPAADAGAGVRAHEIVVDGAVAGATGPGGSRFSPAAALAEGPHTWRVRAVDAAGNASEGPGRRFTIDTTPPAASLTVGSSPALAGTVVAFDAAASADAVTRVERYEWDLDGDGTYEVDTAGQPVASRRYDEPSERIVRLRVTDAAGHTATAEAPLRITPAPLPGPPGVSIAGGARYANDPKVRLTLRWPSFATGMLVSNDGGFAGAVPLALTHSFEWRLDSGGAEHLPKTVYVRFLGGLAGNETYQDDIVLDEGPPVIMSASVRPADRRRGAHRVRVRARDRVSGVVRMQLAATRDRPGPVVAYRRSMTVRGARAPRWVRAYDRAGNRSRWRRLARGG